MRLLLRGGSIASGYSVRRNYAEWLRDRFEGIEIINRSRFRDTSFHGVWTFDEDIEVFAPDILMIHFGVDDAYHPVYRSEFKENLVTIVRKARKSFDPTILLLTSHPFENLHDMQDVSIYYRVVREVANDLCCGIVPVHLKWISEIEKRGAVISDFLQKDTRYPNEMGHELYAEAIYSHIKNIIEGHIIWREGRLCR